MPRKIPSVVFPLAIDDDYSLFKTFNSAQTTLARDLVIEAEIIEITPRSANQPDIWSDNGFVTIEKELIYYDSVVKNSSGKVVQLKDCVRAVEGKSSNYITGTPVYANVVAQEHNQLVDAVLAIEETIGDISDMLKVGPLLKVQNGIKKNLIRPQLTAENTDVADTSLHASLTAMLGQTAMVDDTCPDIEFEFNFSNSNTAEFCIRIFGNYTSFALDFGDGVIESNQLSGTHYYSAPPPYNPMLTVVSTYCTLTVTPTSTDCEGCETPPLPDPSVPFVIQIPLVPPWPSFTPSKIICPGPLLNLPPIIFPSYIFCPSEISKICPTFTCPTPSVVVSVSIIDTCKFPSVISIISPCQLSIVSLIGCQMPSVISLAGCCVPSIIHVIAPSFSPISFTNVPSFSSICFCPTPSFAPICFCPVPSFSCISFCTPPNFPAISFGAFPSTTVSFDVLVNLSVSPVCFCTPPSFAPISFAAAPVISVNWGVAPTLSCIVTVKCSSSTTAFAPQGFAFGSPAPPRVVEEEIEDLGIPVTINDLGIPEEINIVAPNIPDIKVIHDIPKEITVKSSIPEEIRVKHDIPATIDVRSDIPRTITVDGSDIPRRILVEVAPDFPSTLKLEVLGMPGTLQVVGIPNTIEIIENIPRTIQLIMPENPTVTMKWDGAPVELKPSPDLEKMLANLIIQPK